jgi:hypothetical protein
LTHNVTRTILYAQALVRVSAPSPWATLPFPCCLFIPSSCKPITSHRLVRGTQLKRTCEKKTRHGPQTVCVDRLFGGSILWVVVLFFQSSNHPISNQPISVQPLVLFLFFVSFLCLSLTAPFVFPPSEAHTRPPCLGDTPSRLASVWSDVDLGLMEQ